MKKIILLSLIQIVCATAGFAQSPPWKANGEAISARPDLTVRWQDFAELDAVADFGNSNVTIKLLSSILSPEGDNQTLSASRRREEPAHSRNHELDGLCYRSASNGTRRFAPA
jgi:hypothetical protein